jgi:selenium metabolism protein YedF
MAESFTVDARGLTCPQPVLETKKVLEQGAHGNFLVLVDNSAARENVSRYARNQGCQVEVQERGPGEFEVRIGCVAGSPRPEEPEELIPCAVSQTSADRGILVYLGSNSLGQGDPALGEKLMRGFLRTWIDVEPRPWRIIFINSGVKLTTIDDEAVEAVSLLEERGVEVLSCGTCLEHFGLSDKLRAGRVTNMFEVIESLQDAAKVVSPD